MIEARGRSATTANEIVPAEFRSPLLPNPPTFLHQPHPGDVLEEPHRIAVPFVREVNLDSGRWSQAAAFRPPSTTTCHY